MTKRKLRLAVSINGTIQYFDDWFDFADYTKQENLAGRVVCVSNWKYV